jgi:hypothetical protein
LYQPSVYPLLIEFSTHSSFDISSDRAACPFITANPAISANAP